MSTLKTNRIENLTTTDGGISINNSGNVGINTSSPNVKLEVGGSVALRTDADVRLTLGSAGSIGSNDSNYIRAATDQIIYNSATSSGRHSFELAGVEKMRLDSSGRLLIDQNAVLSDVTTQKLEVSGDVVVNSKTTGVGQEASLNLYHLVSTGTATRAGGRISSEAESAYTAGDATSADSSLVFSTTLNAVLSEKMRLDRLGRMLVGLSTVPTSADATNSKLLLSHESGANLIIARDDITIDSGDVLGGIEWHSNDNGSSYWNEVASIYAAADAQHFSTQTPTRLVFSTCGVNLTNTERMRIGSDGSVQITMGGSGYSTLFRYGTNEDNYIRSGVNGITTFGDHNGGERMRINSDGSVGVGITSHQVSTNSGSGGHFIGYPGYFAAFANSSNTVAYFNRIGSDGNIINLRGQGSDEGSISVSGSTVSFNGGHLSRWSQLPGGAERTEILRGSVLSNIDEMCEWGEEDNEQLNRMQVSNVEGDRNVSGVFQAWDDDDDTYTNDFYCAMTGDFVIRIAQGTSVARGDLLMSAGDGTAKPQDDDIVRSKTIAKVTSTNVSCTYDDGSYCVPCVLMAC